MNYHQNSISFRWHEPSHHALPIMQSELKPMQLHVHTSFEPAAVCRSPHQGIHFPGEGHRLAKTTPPAKARTPSCANLCTRLQGLAKAMSRNDRNDSNDRNDRNDDDDGDVGDDVGVDVGDGVG